MFMEKNYELTRNGVIYFIKEDEHSGAPELYLKISISMPIEDLSLSDQWRESRSIVHHTEPGLGLKGYKIYSPKNETAFKAFYEPQAGDVWQEKNQDDGKYYKCKNPYFPPPSSKKSKTHKIFNSYLSKDQKIIIFAGLLIAAVLLIGITILTAGAAAGVMLPGAAGFLNAMSALTGIASASLATSSGFAGLVSIAVGSILLSILCFTGMKRVGSLGSKENFFPGQKYVEEEYPSESKSEQVPAPTKTKSQDRKELADLNRERSTIFEDITEGAYHFPLGFQKCISKICCLPLPPELTNENTQEQSIPFKKTN